MPEDHEEYRVAFEVRTKYANDGKWVGMVRGPYRLKHNAGRECERRRRAAGSYRNVRIERRVVTVGEWEEVKNVR